MYTSIPTYSSETDQWSYTDFETKDKFTDFVKSKFIPPGEIKLRNTKFWRMQAANYDKNGYYCNAPYKSKDFMNYWDKEKEKCTKGVIIDEFYLTRYYYFWINFLPINDKEVNKLKFPKIWDSQYYFFLYEMICELTYKYSVIVKKRQWGSTFQHLAILLNDVWFEEGFINKIGASDEEYLKADWAMLEEYRSFLIEHTAWVRGFNPDKLLNWQQRWEVKKAGRKTFIGNKSILKGLNFKVSPTKGVGGKNNKFYYEEAGITKTMGKTFSYIDPALKLGALTTGIFMAGGSVGELEQCEDLKKMAINPKGFNILPIENTFEEFPDIKEICFFVPVYWSMMPFIDEEGNSLIEKSKEWCDQERRRISENSSPEDFRMYVSQNPLTLAEAFAWRKESVFPQAKLIRQQERIIADKLYGTPVELSYDGDTNRVMHKISDRIPLRKFPLGEKDNAEGCIEVWEWPDPKAPWLTYFAGVDPIATDKTTSSPSLFSIYIFKNLVEKRIIDSDGKEKLTVDGYKPVAAYTGRYDDMKKTNEMAERLVVWYNALTAVENNVASFINHMQARSLQRFLATKDQLSFVSDLKTNKAVYQVYGFKTNETIKTYFIDILSEYLSEVMDIIKKQNSDDVVKTVYGVERIRDYALLEELRQYHDKLNVDRFIAFSAGLALMKAFRKSGIGVMRIDETEKKEEHVERVTHLGRSFFKHYGDMVFTRDDKTQVKSRRSFFKRY